MYEKSIQFESTRFGYGWLQFVTRMWIRKTLLYKKLQRLIWMKANFLPPCKSNYMSFLNMTGNGLWAICMTLSRYQIFLKKNFTCCVTYILHVFFIPFYFKNYPDNNFIKSIILFIFTSCTFR
jgi:hypothetical protein